MMKDRSRIVYPNNAPEVKYKKMDERSYCFGSLAFDFNAIDDSYLEE